MDTLQSIPSQDTNINHMVVQDSQMFANIEQSITVFNKHLMFAKTVLSVKNVCVWLGMLSGRIVAFFCFLYLYLCSASDIFTICICISPAKFWQIHIWWRIYCHDLSLHLTNIKLFEIQGLTGDKAIYTSSTAMTKVSYR